MAASFRLCASNLCFAFCSCTSCALQKGHQSAERKKRSTVPFGPLSVSLDCSCPNWSGMENAGPFCPTESPTAETLLADKSSCAFNQGKKLIKNKSAAENFMNHL